MKRFFPWIILVLALGSIIGALLPAKNPGAFDLVGFSQLPVLSGGRIKPMDTLARSSLLELQARQTIYLPDGSELTPNEWLMDVFFRAEVADTYPTFVIDNLELLSLLGREPDSLKIPLKTGTQRILAMVGFLPTTQRRFPFTEIEPHLAEIDRQATLATAVDAQVRTPFQRSVVDLRNKILLYHGLKHTVGPSDDGDFLGELLNFQKVVGSGVAAIRAKEANAPHDEAAAKMMLELGQRYLFMADASNILAIPPPAPMPVGTGWKNIGQSLLETFQTGQVNVAALSYAGFGHAWRNHQPEQFNGLVTRFRAALEKNFSAELAKCRAEQRFNHADLFYNSMMLFAYAFVLAIVSWLKWPEALGRAAFWLILLAWAITTSGIIARMWLEGRPPVTNLYSSALFIGWGATTLCIFLELLYKNAIGSVAAGVIGFGTLFIAHHLALSGDTLEMMRAVLDSNFWLATHVVVVVLGYASTFLAGFLALIYIFRGLFTRTLDKATADALGRMVYGIVCFATLFSFVGTILGGIWADQSWGRFWGWDPKENGAVLIVIWNAIILHARWGGLVRQRGLMCLAVFGNIVTSWSWFGTNMLGVGLHSYGFTEAAFWSLSTFVATQLVIIGLANIPLEKWRSFRPNPSTPAPRARQSVDVA